MAFKNHDRPEGNSLTTVPSIFWDAQNGARREPLPDIIGGAQGELSYLPLASMRVTR